MSINQTFTGPNLTKLASNPRAQKIVSDLANSSKVLPVAFLETSVIAGRSYHAQKRGGYWEFQETLLENLITAVIWMGGVRALNKVADFIAKKAFNINTKIDWKQVANEAKGRINPEKFIKATYSAKALKLLFSVGTSIFAVGVLIPKWKQKLTRDQIQQQKQEKSQHQAAVGFAANSDLKFEKTQGGVFVPKNITATDLRALANAPVNNGVRFGGENVVNIPSTKDISFNGFFDVVSRVGYALENEAIPQLAVVDTGVTGGRIINARNKDEGIEIFFRDVASCMVYYSIIPIITGALAKAFDAKLGINTKIDPLALNSVTEEFNKKILDIAKANKGVIGLDDIQKALMGTNNEAVSNAIKKAIITSQGKQMSPEQLKKIVANIDDILPKTLAETANMSKTQLVNELRQYLGGISSRAVQVAKMQASTVTSGNIRSLANLVDDISRNPAMKTPQVEEAARALRKISNNVYAQVQSGTAVKTETVTQLESIISKLKASKLDDAIISKVDDALKVVQTSAKSTGYITQEAIEEVIKGGVIRDSKFLSKVLSNVNGAVKDPMAYVAKGEKVELQKTVKLYAQRVMQELEKSGAIKPGEKIDLKKVEKVISSTIEQAKSKSFNYKVAYIAASIALGVTLLGWIIPKTQYLITKMRTGKDEFPGVAGLLDDDKSKKSKGAQVASFAKEKPGALKTGSVAFDSFLKDYMAHPQA